MVRFTDQAIVLRRWEWSETSQTVALFTQSRGVLRGLAKGAKREKSSFSGGFEPLTRGQIVAIDRKATELALLTEWDLQEVFRVPRRNLHAHYAALYLMDLTLRIMGHADPHPNLWWALVRSLRAIDAGAAPSLAAMLYQWAALVETGRQPDLSAARGCDARDANSPLVFDPQAGRFVDPATAATRKDVWRVRRSTASLLGQASALHDACIAPVDLASQRDWGAHANSLADTDVRTVSRANHFLAALHFWVDGGEAMGAVEAFLGRPLTVIRRLRKPQRHASTLRRNRIPARSLQDR